MFGEQVTWVRLAQHLVQRKPFGANGLLHPERMCIDMSQLTQPLTPAYADRSGRIGPYAEVGFIADIAHQALHA